LAGECSREATANGRYNKAVGRKQRGRVGEEDRGRIGNVDEIE
jgi:hypothetical protein